MVSRLVSGVTYTRSGKHVRGRTHCGASSGCRIRRLRRCSTDQRLRHSRFFVGAAATGSSTPCSRMLPCWSSRSVLEEPWNPVHMRSLERARWHSRECANRRVWTSSF